MKLSHRSWSLWFSTTTLTAASATTITSSFCTISVRQGVTTTTTTTTTASSSSPVAFGRFHRSSRRHHRHLRRIPWTSNHIDTAVKMSTSSSSTSSSMVRVGLCQFQVSSNKLINHQRATEYLQRAAEQGVQLAVLPEIWNGPYATAAFGDYAEVLPNVGDTYSPEDDDATTSSSSSSSSARLLQQLARELNLWIVGGSMAEQCPNQQLYNTCLVLNPQGQVVAKHRKVHLFDINVPGGISFQESATLSPGQTLSWFDSPFGRIGIGICYDIRFPEYALALAKMTNQNPNLPDDIGTESSLSSSSSSSWPTFLSMLIYPGAFNLTTGPAHWELLQRARALDNQCYCITASPARVTAEEAALATAAAAAKMESESTNMSSSPIASYPHYTAWGHSTVVGPWGNVIATCEEGPALVVTDIDLSKVVQIRQQIPILQQKRYDLYTSVDSTNP